MKSLSASRELSSRSYRTIKRGVDVMIAGVGLLLMLPLMAVVAIWIKAESPGPIFFRQARVGLGLKLFNIYKFRTMVLGADRAGDLTIGADPRVTSSGRLLRWSKFDELPQLVNVLIGEMSLVGPRPEIPRLMAFLPPEMQAVLCSVRPGITDRASVDYRDESALLGTYSDPVHAYVSEVLPKKAEIRARQVLSASLFEDMKILGLTLHTLGHRLLGGDGHA